MTGASKAKRPANIIYSVDDKLPLLAALPVVLQQVIFLSLDLVFPILIVQSFQGSSQLAQSFVSLTMLAMGVGTILQALKRGTVGSGLYCPQETGALYFPASLLAVQKGGFPLLMGMTVFVGIAEICLAKVIHRLRVLFPAELTGLVVVMLGITLIPVSISFVSGSDLHGGPVDIRALQVGFLTLSLIIALDVWGKGAFRQYSIIVGIVSGYIFSYLNGVLTKDDFQRVIEAPILAIPDISHIGWAFDWELVVPFFIAFLCSTLKTIGNVTVCQKADDLDWKRLNMRSAEGGLIAEGMSNLLAGMIGGMGQNSSAGGIGLAIASGVTSRYVGFIVGGTFVVLAFLPKISVLFTIMPKPVIGALLTVGVVFILVTGMQILLARMLDTRKTFVIGLSLIFGLSVDILPVLYTNVPPDMKVVFASSFSVATVVAIGLNLLFRLGVAKTQTIELEPGKVTADTIFDFLEQAGSSWGARREIVAKAVAALNEFIESAAALALVDGSVKVAAVFDEYNLDLHIYYQGREMDFPASRPSPAELLEDDQAFVRLSGYMMRKYADKIQTDSDNGLLHVKFHFEH